MPKRSNNAPDFDKFDDTKPAFKLIDMLDGPRNLIRRLYGWVVSWADKPSGEKALGTLSFAESSFFPIPPDPLLVAMVVGAPNKWLRLATITTLASVLGGIFGYLIGWLAIGAVTPLIVSVGYEEAYQSAVQWFAQYGAIAIIVAGFTPIPYKIFTIAGGAAQMFFPLFVLGSIIGRGSRFFLVAYLMYHFGRRYKDQIEKYVDILGFIFIILVVVGFIVLKYVL